MSTVPFRSGSQRTQAQLMCRFAHQLSVVTETAVGARWMPAATPDEWQIVWSDGPTVASMRQYAATLGNAVVGVDPGRLSWVRQIRIDTFALALVTNVRRGEPPLGTAATPAQLREALAHIDYPEWGTPRDVVLAARLVRVADRLETDMVRFLLEHGLAGLGETTPDAGANVIDLRSHRLKNQPQPRHLTPR
jgi:hypothetical protein